MNNHHSAETPSSPPGRFIPLLYRARFPLAILSLAIAFVAFALGIGKMGDFSARVDSLNENPPEVSQPKMFDTRTDIWFDPLDEGLAAYRDVEDQFIAEDVVVVAFEEAKGEWGVFSEDSLRLIEKLTAEFEKVPYVRNVRSITSSPWIRNGEVAPGENGLIVTDLFDGPVKDFSRDDRLRRMVAVLGAERASKLAGRDEVQRIIGDGEDFSEHQGEPRFIDSIISADGRTAALQLQVIRQRAEEDKLAAAFPTPSSGNPDIGQALYTIEAQSSAVGKIVEHLSQVEDKDIRIAGIPVIERHFPEVGQKDMAWLGLMFLVIGGALFLIYRKLSGVFLPLLIVSGSIFLMNGVVWWKGDLINNLTATTPIIMTAVGIADAVHLVTAYFLLKPQFNDKGALIIEVLRKNALPVFLTSLTTVVAFLSLTVSAIIPVQQLGYTAALGTVAAYLLSMTVVPAVLSLLPLKKKKELAKANAEEEAVKKPYWTDAIASFVARRRTGILLASIATIAIAALGVNRLKIESDMRLMFPETDPVVSQQNWIEDHLGGAGDLDLVFYGAPSAEDEAAFEKVVAELESLRLKELAGETLSPAQKQKLTALKVRVEKENRGRIASNSRFLTQVDALEQRIVEESKQPDSPLKTITSFDSGLSVLRRMHQVQNENAAAFYRVPVEKDVPEAARQARVLTDPFTEEHSLVPAQSASTLSAQYYLQYENGAKPAENLTPFVSPDRRGFRIAGRVSAQSSSEMLQAYDRIREIARTEFPEIAGSEEDVANGAALSTMRLSGKHYLFMNMMERFTDTMMQSLGLALLVITLVIGFVFRSARVALVSMVPNIMPLVVPLAVFGLLGISLDGPAVIVATIALGVCVDDTIHLLTKFSKARKRGETTEQAIVSSFRQVGGALTWTTITLVLGFAVLSLSQFRPNMLIGVLGAAMVGLAWIADLIVTPALLSLVFPGVEEATEERASIVPESHPSPAE